MPRAYAKINIGLQVLGKRPDGYHTIETVFHRIDLFDDITLEPAEEIRIESSSPEVPADASNICFKAATLLQHHCGYPGGVRIHIEKRIPVGAGLGGGSSDAAVVLTSLPPLWGHTADERTLRAMALQLGSDVPYFLGEGSAVATGRGELLEYFSLDIPYTILLCNPNIHISTEWAYHHVRPRAQQSSVDLKSLVLGGMSQPLRLVNGLRNDFEPVVFRTYPEVLKVKDAMMRGGADFASMSGSGSSIFGFFSRLDYAHDVAAYLKVRGYRTFFTKPHFIPPT